MISIQEEVPADIRDVANQIGRQAAQGFGVTLHIAAALLAERNRAIEECAGIAADDDGHFSQYGEDRNTRVAQQTCRDAAAAIRALLK